MFEGEKYGEPLRRGHSEPKLIFGDKNIYVPYG